MSTHFLASSTASIHETAHIGVGTQVYEGAIVCADVTIGASCYIGGSSTICGGSWIGNSVHVGPNVLIGDYALIQGFARICPDRVSSGSSDARRLLAGATIGEGVLLHNEVELGLHATIPSQRTIASLGNFGTKNRVVTIYGSNEGPRFSIGCQVGVTWETIRSNIRLSEHTQPESAATYEPFLPVFKQVAAVVQKAYDRESNHVAELQAMRQALGMPFDT